MSDVPPEAGVASVVLGAVGALVRYVFVPWLQKRHEKKRYAEVDDMADSGEFRAVRAEMQAMAHGMATHFAGELAKRDVIIADLKDTVGSLTRDLLVATRSANRANLRADYFGGELNNLRRSAGMPPVPLDGDLPDDDAPPLEVIPHAAPLPDERTPVHSRAGRPGGALGRVVSAFGRGRAMGGRQNED